MKEVGKILTLIIPSYNMEHYIGKCLDSLLIHCHLNAVEVIVVNDGSQDRTSEIAHRYERMYVGIITVLDQVNGNYGSCINHALAVASGKYVKILDADDSFDTIHFERFISFLLQTDADLVLSDYVIVNTDGEITEKPYFNCSKLSSQGYDDVVDLASPDFIAWIQMHAVTYRTELLVKMGYRQCEGLSYTDQQWIFAPMIYVKMVVFFHLPVYRYLIGREGQTMDPRVMKKQARHLDEVIWNMLDDFNRYRADIVDERLPYFYGRLSALIKGKYVNSLCHYSLNLKKELLAFDWQLKSRCPEIYDYIQRPILVRGFRFSYVEFWRRHRHVPIWAVRILSRLLIRILN